MCVDRCTGQHGPQLGTERLLQRCVCDGLQARQVLRGMACGRWCSILIYASAPGMHQPLSECGSTSCDPLAPRKRSIYLRRPANQRPLPKSMCFLARSWRSAEVAPGRGSAASKSHSFNTLSSGHLDIDSSMRQLG